MNSAYDYIIVGGGIIGVTTALQIRKHHPIASILVVEKEATCGSHSSGRNSGVLHAGIYYEPGTLKAKICTQGAMRMRAYCKENDLAIRTKGKVILPQSQNLDHLIDTLHDYATRNGAKTEIISTADLLKLEPHANPNVSRALHSPNTVVIDPQAVLEHMIKQFRDLNITIKYGSKVSKIDPSDKSLILHSGKVSYGHLVNAAGAYADKIAHKMGVAKNLTMIPFKGRYYSLSKTSAAQIEGNIYPVPDLSMPVLGVHFTKSVQGTVYVGPTATPALGRENYQGLENVDHLEAPLYMGRIAQQYFLNRQGMRGLVHQEVQRLFKSQMIKEARTLVPGITARDLQPCQKVGIRPQLYDCKAKKLLMDFHIEKGPSSTHILNAVSPAFTGSLAFAEYLLDNFVNK